MRSNSDCSRRSRSAPHWGADGKTDEETETQHQEQREEMVRGEPGWE